MTVVSEFRSCVEVEASVPNKPTVSVDVKHHSAKHYLARTRTTLFGTFPQSTHVNMTHIRPE